MEEETLPPAGFRFNPFDKELITHYLKPFILGQDLPCNIIKERQVYGEYSNPWEVFDPNDNRLWFTSPDIKPTEKYTFAFAHLSKLSTSNTSTTLKNTKKTAGCGTWVGMTSRDQITDDKNIVIGEKRYLKFKIKHVDSAAVGGVDLSQVGCFRMHEYSLSGVNSGLASADTTVLCKITHDSSKVCQIVAKNTGTKSSDHILTSSSKAVKKEGNNNNLESDSVKAENLTLIDCGGGGDNLDVKKQENNNLESDSVKSENLTLIYCDGGYNLDESKTFNSQSLVERNSDISDWPAAPQYNRGVQEVDETLIDCGGGDNLDESKTFNSQSLVERNSVISDWTAAPQYNSGVQEVDETLIDCGGGGDNLDEIKTFNSQSLVERISDISDWTAAPQYNSGVQEVDETLIDCGGGDNLDEIKIFNSQSLVERISDISDWTAAPQYNSGVQEVDELGGNFCFDDLGAYSFSLDDLDFNDTDWMGYLNFQQEEPLEDSTNNKPGKRKFELEENLHQAKKMCLE